MLLSEISNQDDPFKMDDDIEPSDLQQRLVYLENKLAIQQLHRNHLIKQYIFKYTMLSIGSRSEYDRYKSVLSRPESFFLVYDGYDNDEATIVIDTSNGGPACTPHRLARFRDVIYPRYREITDNVDRLYRRISATKGLLTKQAKKAK